MFKVRVSQLLLINYSKFRMSGFQVYNASSLGVFDYNELWMITVLGFETTRN